jgi:hypothetical protein
MPDAADCAALLAQMLASPIVPPDQYGSWRLSSGMNPKGLTIEEANSAGCGVPIVENKPSTPGYRGMAWGPQKDVTVWYNLESHVVAYVDLAGSFTGTLSFHSRVNGMYGSHTYEIGIGYVRRDGVDFPLSWAVSSPSLNELYDGMMATFEPATAPIADCYVAHTCLHIPDDGSGNAYFGARPLHFFMQFQANTNRVTMAYTRWPGGTVDCSTPTANSEYVDYADILYFSYGIGIGGIDLGKVGTNPNGMTWHEANAIACDGTQVNAPDPGYKAIQWGANGEVELEYNTTTQPDLGYKLFAKQGYKGTFAFSSSGDGGAHSYVIAIGAITKDAAPFAIDWSNAAAANAAVTELSNAALGYADADCVAAGHCAVTPDDGAGHSSFALLNIPLGACGAAGMPPCVAGTEMDFVFPQGTSTISSIVDVWPLGR